MRETIEFIKNTLQGKLRGVEVGVHNGNNASYILKTLDMEMLYLVDIWGRYMMENNIVDTSNLYEEVKDKFKDVDNVEIFRTTSELASKTIHTLDFVYLDANHEYHFVNEDINYWFPKIRPGGVLGGHDYSSQWPGVMMAVNKFITETKLELHTGGLDWWVVKK